MWCVLQIIQSTSVVCTCLAVSLFVLCLTSASSLPHASPSLSDDASSHQVQTLCEEIITMTGIPPHPNIVNALGYSFKGKTLSVPHLFIGHQSPVASLYYVAATTISFL